MTSSIHEQIIKDLNYIAQNNPELFTEEVRASLENLLSTLPDDLKDIEEISDAIVIWVEEHPQIHNTLMKLPISSSSERGAGGIPTRITPKEAKGLLDNIVRQSKSSSQSKTSSQL
ncbi:hypothetical protein [Nostoc punctiforme]|uniref:Uncharacterized protein n=1 Tax=Nostoc punctiforme (strain ATCC 29133 / PCC 73102) TaxID=63737 RepID=B2J8J3_NOSP7|nr:hypothetical protein [Nostoc punctiforme]ACC80970.1 conserved hypothetical protein [Nostoc punctiforme PCC 73102]